MEEGLSDCLEDAHMKQSVTRESATYLTQDRASKPFWYHVFLAPVTLLTHNGICPDFKKYCVRILTKEKYLISHIWDVH